MKACGRVLKIVENITLEIKHGTAGDTQVLQCENGAP